MASRKVKVEDEEMDADCVDEFHKAVRDIRENDSRHQVPGFLRNRMDPVKEFRKIRNEIADEVAILPRKKKVKS